MSLLSPSLQTFMAVVTHKTVHAAAQAIHLTQTAVTQRIHNLEHHLQTTLFIRSRRGMTLTVEGEALLRYCQAATELEGEALANIRHTAKKTEVSVRICGPSSMMRARIIPIAETLTSSYPNLLFHFIISDEKNRQAMLRSGECDFAILAETELLKAMHVKTLKPEQYVLVATKKWKGRKLKDILAKERIVDFNPRDEMTFQYLKRFQLIKNDVISRHFANNIESIAQMVCNGLGFSTLTKEFADKYINQDQLTLLNQGRIYENKLFLAWYARSIPPNYFTAIIDAVH